MSLRLRMALLSGIAVAVIVVVFGVTVFGVTVAVLYTTANGEIQTAQAQLERRFERTLPEPLANAEGSVYIDGYTPAGELIRQGPGLMARTLPVTPKELNQALNAPEGTQTQVFRHPFLMHIVTMTGTVAVPGTGALSGPVAVQVVVFGQDVSGAYSAMSQLGIVLSLAGLVILVVSVGVFWLVTGRALRPVTELTRAAEWLGAGGDLSRRLPLPATNDEIRRLSVTFNASLDRLEGAYRALADALERQRRFVADASHELRTPLTVILSNAENMRDVPDLPTQERIEWLNEMIEEAKRMANLSSDLLLLARADTDEPLRLGEIRWSEFFEDLRRDAVRLCDPRPVHASAPAELGVGFADRSSLVRVFRVLFENIARHTPETAQVLLGARREAENVVFAVADTGPGVPAAQLPHIFDRFFRADESRHGRGTGLGLAIAHQLVSRHHGVIAARNRPQGGLEFRISIPVTLERPAGAAAAG
ncbi:MAG: HAMP domain-containing histidine kinase [Candidatus Dormibacteraeota bacterium]|nr:HAMP domain-containing histidine kinase [Candidatus Dormibacteraeota bacterium]MBO0744714.1 HAMP domain-containing histidine kinase [Candidatus Dormibacteraeota bacterium]